MNLVPGLYEEFGGFTLGIVFAHEFGHAIQTRAGVEGDTIMTELQADCFAGAWTADVAAGQLRASSSCSSTTSTRPSPASSSSATASAPTPPTRRPTAPASTASARSPRASRTGLERCADYPDLYDAGELVIVEVPFTDQEDFERGGNLPLDEVVEPRRSTTSSSSGPCSSPSWARSGTRSTVVEPDRPGHRRGHLRRGHLLRRRARRTRPSTASTDDTIYLDAANLVPALYEIGDYAVATELARQFAYAAQVRLGNLDNTLATNLQADCYAGVYAYSGFSVNRGEEQLLVLSPGDLDEAVIAFLLTSDSSADVDEDGNVSVGTAFQRFDAYRTGFLEGISRLRRPRRRGLASARARRDVEHDASPPRRRSPTTTSPNTRSCSAPPRSPASSGAWPGVGPRDDLGRRQLGHGGRWSLAEVRPAARPADAAERRPPAAAARRPARAARTGFTGASGCGASAGRTAVAAASASIVRTSSRSQSQRPPSLRSRPSATPGRARSVNATTRVAGARGAGRGPLEEADRAVEGTGRGAHDGPGDDVALEQRLVGRGQVPLQGRIGHHGDLRLGVLAVRGAPAPGAAGPATARSGGSPPPCRRRRGRGWGVMGARR